MRADGEKEEGKVFIDPNLYELEAIGVESPLWQRLWTNILLAIRGFRTPELAILAIAAIVWKANITASTPLLLAVAVLSMAFIGVKDNLAERGRYDQERQGRKGAHPPSGAL